jgi:hypothetical protein
VGKLQNLKPLILKQIVLNQVRGDHLTPLWKTARSGQNLWKTCGKVPLFCGKPVEKYPSFCGKKKVSVENLTRYKYPVEKHPPFFHRVFHRV